MWSNDQKRREFVKDFKPWGVWFIQPELGLTFYKYDLPDGNRIIAMEYVREPYYYEESKGDVITCCRLYLQKEKYFNPSPVSEYVIADHLKELKVKLIKEQKSVTDD
jgi:hypothetical protein